MEFSINFTDITMVEADGDYQTVKAIMEEDWIVGSDNGKKNIDWTIRTDLTITGQDCFDNLTVQFRGNGDVHILDYNSSIGNVFYNRGVQIFSMWVQENGWKVPQPSQFVIAEAYDFWKHFYDTFVIDSEYFDKITGGRE